VAPEDNKRLVRRMREELLSSRDLDRVDQYFAPHFVSHDNPPGLPEGREGVRAFFAMFQRAMSDVTVEIDQLVAEGDWVVAATTTRGTHTGELLGIPPTDRQVAVGGIDMVRIEDGLIVEHRGLTDTVGLMRQLAEGPA
jgi:steroid delta-isomerase-like uncharacterized protein